MATFLPACVFSVDPAAPRYLTAALYQFVDLPDFAELRAPLQALCESHGVRGMLLLAHEGINGTIAGPAEGVQAVLAWLRKDPRFAALQHKEAATDAMPFYRMRVRLKKEIVTLGVPGLNPARNAGTYVKPEDWNALIDDPGVVELTRATITKWASERLTAPSTRTPAAFPNFRRGWQNNRSPVVCWLATPRWRCFARAAFAAKNPRPFSNHKALRRCTTWKAAFSSTWKQCKRSPAAGRATALCLTSGCP